MKKTYVKPQIFFEDFSLSTNIAAGCENPTNLPSQDQCGIYFEGPGHVFFSGMTGCDDFSVENDGKDTFNGICYHTPTEANNLFAS